MARSKRSWRRILMIWLLIPVMLYVTYCGLLFFFQTKLLFPAGLTGGPSGETPHMRIELDTDEGRTVSWYDPAPDADENNPAPLVVFFHGNAELVDQQQTIIRLYHDLGISVFMVEYRGYGDSEATPSQAHIVADTVELLNIIKQQPEIDAGRLVFHGRSIGGGLAAQVALQTKPQALIVENTFKSVSGMAWRYGVPPFLVKSPLRTEQAFRQLDLPILIMHGKSDEIVPASHAKALDKAAKDSTLLLFNASHNTLPTPAEKAMYDSAVRKHLEDAEVLRRFDPLKPNN